MKKIIITFFIFLLCGCYNYKELNKIAIVSSIGIDKKKDNYIVSAQIMNAKNDEKSDSSNIIVYSEKGKSIDDALRKITQKSPKLLYGGHLNKLVISEEVAKDGIINVIDIFQRLTEIKDEFTITVSRNIEANKVIKIITSSENIPAEYVKDTIENADLKDALTNSSKLDEFVSFYLKDYIDPVISVVEIKNYNKKGTSIENTENSDPKTKIILNNIAITHNGKLEKYLNKNETIGYNFIQNRINEIVIPIKCNNKYYSSISVEKSKTSTKVIKKNNKYTIIFNINVNGSISEYNCSNDLTKEKNIIILQKKTKNKIKKYVQSVIKTQKNSKSEFLGLKRKIYLDYPKYKNEDYNIKIKINVNLSKKGEIRNSSKGEKYEYKN